MQYFSLAFASNNSSECLLQWGSEIDHLNPDFLKVGFQMGRISYGWALALAIAIVPTIKKTGPFEIWTFLSGLQIVFDKLAAICLDFKWLGFRISDPVRNPDHLPPNLFLTIQSPDWSGFQIPIVICCLYNSYWTKLGMIICFESESNNKIYVKYFWKIHNSPTLSQKSLCAPNFSRPLSCLNEWMSWCLVRLLFSLRVFYISLSLVVGLFHPFCFQINLNGM